jgi:hypothetical protein
VSALAALLPFIALLIWAFLLFQLGQNWTRRDAFIYAAVGWGVFTVLLTELLSLAHCGSRFDPVSRVSELFMLWYVPAFWP